MLEFSSDGDEVSYKMSTACVTKFLQMFSYRLSPLFLLQTPKTRRGDFVWDAPPALDALVKQVYLSMVGTRRDHSVCVLGRSGTGKTTTCQAFTYSLLKQAGTAGQNISGEYLASETSQQNQTLDTPLL